MSYTRNVIRNVPVPQRTYMCLWWRRGTHGWKLWRAQRRQAWAFICQLSNEDLLDEWATTYCDDYYTSHYSDANARFLSRVVHERLRACGFLPSINRLPQVTTPIQVGHGFDVHRSE